MHDKETDVWLYRRATCRNWMNFLGDNNNNNKSELFNFLADQMFKVGTPNTLIMTKRDMLSHPTKRNQTINQLGMKTLW